MLREVLKRRGEREDRPANRTDVRPTRAFDAKAAEAEKRQVGGKAPSTRIALGEDGRARDTETGQFVPKPEAEAGASTPSTASAAPAEGTPEATPPESPKPRFKIGDKEYTSIDEVQADWHRVNGRLSASDKRNNELAQRLDSAIKTITAQTNLLREAGLVSDQNFQIADPRAIRGQVQPQPQPTAGARAAEGSDDVLALEDYFAPDRSIVHDEQTWDTVAELWQSKGPVFALAYALQTMERRQQQYHRWLTERVLAERLAPADRFFSAMSDVQETAGFVQYEFSREDPSTGEPLYKDLPHDRQTVAAIVNILDSMPGDFSRTPQGFNMAYRLWKAEQGGRTLPGNGSGQTIPAGQPSASPAPGSSPSDADALSQMVMANMNRDLASAGAVVPGSAGPRVTSATSQRAPEQQIKERIRRAGGMTGRFQLGD